MASKTEYYDRIISSLQSDITSQKSEISELKLTVARQQKEIEVLNASQGGITQKSSEPQQKWITTENLLLAVKRACDGVIRSNNERLPTLFADRQEFDNFRKSAETKFLVADTFVAYKKSLDTRLKSIEEKLSRRRFSLLITNRHNHQIGYHTKSFFNLNTIIQFFESNNPQWIFRILVSLSIVLLAIYLYSRISV